MINDSNIKTCIILIVMTLASSLWACTDGVVKFIEPDYDDIIQSLKEKRTFKLNDETSKRVLKLTELEIESLDIPKPLQLVYYTLNEAIAFLWSSKKDNTKRERLFYHLGDYFKMNRANASFLLDDMEKNQYSVINVDTTGPWSPFLKTREDITFFVILTSMIFDKGLVPEKIGLSDQFGDFFANAFYPYRKDLISMVEKKKKSSLTSEIALRTRIDEYLHDHAKEDEYKALITYLGKKVHVEHNETLRVTKKKIEEIYRKIALESDGHLIEGHTYYDTFRDSLFEEIMGLSGKLSISSDVALSDFEVQKVVKMKLFKELKYPSKVASLIASLMLYIKNGFVPKEWNKKSFETILNHTLSHEMTEFRRAIRPYIKVGEKEKTYEELIQRPTYYHLPVVKDISPSKSERPEFQVRNPNKRKNNHLRLTEPTDIERENENHIPVVSSDDTPIFHYELLPYGNPLLKDLRKIDDKKVIGIFHNVHLPKILANPKAAGKKLYGKLSECYKVKFSVGGINYRVAYRFLNKKVEIISIGIRKSKFYGRLENKI